MTYRPRASCKRCGKPRGPGVHISRRGNCLECGASAELENLENLVSHQGAYWHHWLDRLTGAVARLHGEAVTPDEFAVAADLDLYREADRWLAG